MHAGSCYETHYYSNSGCGSYSYPLLLVNVDLSSDVLHALLGQIVVRCETELYNITLRISVWLGVFMLQNLAGNCTSRGDWDRCHLSMITRRFEPI